MYKTERGASRRHKALALLGSAAVTSSLLIIPSFASAKGTALEEVIVTARKREEVLQDVPIAVSAFTGKQLQRQGINNLTDFNTRVPNIELQSGNGVGGDANIYIRGIGQRETKVNIDSGVGIYLDGVYLARASGALLDISDVASVQVLRGPQGTLFGKNTTGGALVINTRQPTDQFEGFVRLGYGNFGLRTGQAAINVPLINDKLFTRLSLSNIKRDGYMKNLAGGPNFNNEDRIAGIWKLRWLASDSVTVDFEASYDKTDQLPRGQKCIYTGPLKFAAAGAKQVGLDYKTACQKSQNSGDHRFESNVTGGYRAKNTMFAATINWDISDSLSLKSITEWRKTVAGLEEDIDATGLALTSRAQSPSPGKDDAVKQYSQEFTLTGDAINDRLHYVAGVFAFQEMAQGGRKIGNTLDNDGHLPEPAIGSFVTEAYKVSMTGRNTRNSALAAYSQFDFAFTDWFTLTAGARYTWEKRELEVRKWRIDPNSIGVPPFTSLSVPGYIGTGQLGVYAVSPPSAFQRTLTFIPSDSSSFIIPAAGAPIFSTTPVDARTPFLREANVTSDSWTPMVSAQFFLPQTRWMDAGNVYLTYSQGFRSGGLAENGDTSLTKFKPEKVKNYEVGFKGDFLAHRLRTNIAAFYTKYDDQQISTILIGTDGNPIPTITNAGSSTIQGVEFELTALPFENFQINFNATFNDGQYDDFEDTVIESKPNPNTGPTAGPTIIPSPQTVDRSDEEMPRLPDRSYFLAAQYTINTRFGTVIPRIEYSRKENISYHFDRASWQSGLYKVPHQSLTNARLTWISPKNTLQLTAWMKNIFDEKFYTGGVPLNSFFGGGGVIINDPRTFGADLTYRW